MHHESAHSGPSEPQETHPTPTIARPSPGIKTAVESLWPKSYLRILRAHYSLYSMINQALYTQIPACQIWALDSWSALSLRGSQVGHNADKGAQELSVKGSIERTVMDAICCKLKEGPCMSQKRPLVCRCWERPPQCKGKRGTRGQRHLASPVAAPGGSSWTVDSQCGHMSVTLIPSQRKRKGAGCGSTWRMWWVGWRDVSFLSPVKIAFLSLRAARRQLPS